MTVYVEDVPSHPASPAKGSSAKRPPHLDMGGIVDALKDQRSTRPGLAAYLPPTKGESEEISIAFSVFQEDPSGRLDYHEVKSAIRAMGFVVHKAQLLQILEQCCEDADGLGVTKQEFDSVAMRFITQRTAIQEITRDFLVFDTRRRGFIDLEDVQRVSRQTGGHKKSDSDLAAMISRFDSDKDGRLSLQDFADATGRGHRL